MKLLLTSAGITNKSIKKALQEMLEKPFRQSSMIFVTTAANVEFGDKGWLIDDFINFRNLGFSSIDMIDISAVPKNIWLPRLESVDVIVFGGGNEAYLMQQIKKAGAQDDILKILKHKVYIGISAGSMITTQKLSKELTKEIFEDDVEEYIGDGKALDIIDFQVCPHLNSKHFPKSKLKYIEKVAKDLKETMYAIDDDTAIKVIDNKVEIISEGKWHKFN